MKKVLVLAILLSMVLHCASRIGFLSYLYQNRHELAYQVGLIAEIPIALCSGDYDFGRGLTIIHQDQPEQSLPPQFLQTAEILLFVEDPELELERKLQFLSVVHDISVIQSQYASPPLAIFHPPC